MENAQVSDAAVYDHIPGGIAIIARTLADGFKEMDAVAFERIYDDTLRRSEEFSRQADDKFSASLDKQDGVRYASLAKEFLRSLGKLREIPKTMPQIVRSMALAETVAFRRAISDFKSMHGES